MGTEIWTTDEAKKLRATARALFTRHDHATTTDPLTRENCGACVLGGYKAARDTGPNYAGWGRAYVQAGYPIPKKWRAAFESELNDENEVYAAHLARDVATFSVTYTD
jgi:hypothetical protein